jgi:hypothetical protein
MNASSISTKTATQFDPWFRSVPALGDISLMDHLYNRLDGAYPHKWRSNFPNQQAIDNWMVSWAEAFEEEGITPADVKAGLKACRTKYDWPPSCAEFIKACKPEVDPLVAYYEAVAGCQARAKGEMGEWSHPAVFWATVKVSAFDLLEQTYSMVKQRWEKALSDEMAKHEWEPIPVPMLALPAPGKSEAAKAEATKMINDLGAAGVIKTPKSPTNHRRWIQKILDRESGRDSTLPDIAVRFAKEAMKERAE